MRKMAKLNVAIADDNERILTMLDEVLTADDDITVVGTARNGEQAYEMILDKKPDVVLLDLVMPGIDGLGVMDKVHAEKNAESMPVNTEYSTKRTCVYIWRTGKEFGTVCHECDS